MSWAAQRTLVESWLTSSAYPFYNTVNEEQKPIDDVWLTLMWGMGNGYDLTYCRDKRAEEGAFSVLIYGAPGTGWNDVITAAEAVRDHLLAQADATNEFSIRNFGLPVEFTEGDAVPWYGVELLFDFDLYR